MTNTQFIYNQRGARYNSDDDYDEISGAVRYGEQRYQRCLPPTKLVDTGWLGRCRCKLEHDDVTAMSEMKATELLNDDEG